MVSTKEAQLEKAPGSSFLSTIVRLGPIFLQLVLLYTLVDALKIEADLGLPQFFKVLLFAFGIHALAPRKYKPIIFFLSFVATLNVFVGEKSTVGTVGLGLLLMGVCHLPISLILRKLLLLAVGLILAGMVIDVIPSLIYSYPLRIICTLFMFRVIVYIYDLPHEREAVSIWQRMNYFFLLPNIIIPLFPIVDYKKFKLSYYNIPDKEVYQKGINLILWSLICILCYRFLYHFVVPSKVQLYGVHEVFLYIVTIYLSVLRLVGLLSFSVGVIRLFGYNLPKIFNYMFFASSFSDLFRRINIYWKDFLMKICYYPIYFRVRKLSPAYALTIATFGTFIFTWLFHVYQWFWVLGTNPISETGMIYWGVFGIIATINTLGENKSKKQKPIASPIYALSHIAKVFGTFLLMALIYSIWMAPTLKLWTGMVIIALNDSWLNWMMLVGFMACLYLLASFLYYLYLRYQNGKQSIFKLSDGTIILVNCLTILVLTSITCLKDKYDSVRLFVNNNEYNSNDINSEFSGYYDEILDINNHIGSRMWARDYSNQEKRLNNIFNSDIVTEVDNVLDFEYFPSKSIIHKGKVFTTNSLGVRDKEYSAIPADNVLRIAMLGVSPTLGDGVGDDEVFENIIEEKLNKEYSHDSLRFEIINFAHSAAGAFHHAYIVKEKVQKLSPDYVMLIDHCRPFSDYPKKLKRIIDKKKQLYPELKQWVNENNVTAKSLTSDMQNISFSKNLTDYSYKILKEKCDSFGLEFIWVFLPPLNNEYYYPEFKNILDKYSVNNQINLSNIYDNYNKELLKIAPDDNHPNAWAHSIIADRLLDEIVELLKLEKQDKNE